MASTPAPAPAPDTSAAPAAAAAKPNGVLAAPTWLTPRLLTAAFRGQDEDIGQVTSIRVRPATGTNENYLSEMFRVHAHIGKSAEVRRLIVKALPDLPEFKALVQDGGYFDREVRMLKETLPRMERLLSAGLSHRPAHELQLGPRVIASCSNGALIMEDLCERGYANGPRREGLDLPHCLVAVRALARMHAASVVLYDRGGENARVLDGLGDGWVDAGRMESFTHFAGTAFRSMATAVRSWPRFGDAVADKLRAAAESVPRLAADTLAAKPGQFRVLCHGDLWSNNIMFDYDEDTAQVRSAVMVDFQMVHRCTPCEDLHYFLSLAASPRVRRESAARLVRAYHAELAACLAATGWRGEPPSLASLQRDMRATEYWGFVSAVNLAPVRFVEAGGGMDTQAMLTDDHPVRIATLHDPVCRNMLEHVLAEAIERGFLDDADPKK